MKNTLNRILKIISSAIFVILVLLIISILVYVIKVRYLASQNRLGEVRTNFYTILTQSMVPNIYPGDVVVTYKNMNNEYKNGDILTYSSDLNGGINITHRIIETYKINGQYSYKTKGDNNSVPDSEIVKGERVLGKVVLKIPKVGFFQQFLVSKHRWIVVIVLPCLGIIIYDIIKMVKGFKKENEITIPEVTNDINQVSDNYDPPVNNNQFYNINSNNQPDNYKEPVNIEKQNSVEILENNINITPATDNDYIKSEPAELLPFDNEQKKTFSQISNTEQTTVENNKNDRFKELDDDDIEFL